MEKTGAIAFKPGTIWKAGLTLFLILFAGKFVVGDALPYFGFKKEVFGNYWDFRWPLIGHISGGLIALLIGPFQFSTKFRNRYLSAHRLLGRIYVIAIAIGAISSVYLAWTSALQVNFAWSLGLQGLAFAWITTTGMAYISVMRRRMLQHKEWMIRSYVVTFAFVLFRWLNGAGFVHEVMSDFKDRGPSMIWVSWVVPLMITEIVLSWKKK